MRTTKKQCIKRAKAAQAVAAMALINMSIDSKQRPLRERLCTSVYLNAAAKLLASNS